MSPERESRPVPRTAPQAFAPAEYRLAELDDLARVVNGAFVVVVEVTGEPVRYRRRPYLTAAAAERAAERALDRGQNVRVYLAELRPLYRLAGGGVE